MTDENFKIASRTRKERERAHFLAYFSVSIYLQNSMSNPENSFFKTVFTILYNAQVIKSIQFIVYKQRVIYKSPQ